MMLIFFNAVLFMPMWAYILITSAIMCIGIRLGKEMEKRKKGRG